MHTISIYLSIHPFIYLSIYWSTIYLYGPFPTSWWGARSKRSLCETEKASYWIDLKEKKDSSMVHFLLVCWVCLDYSSLSLRFPVRGGRAPFPTPCCYDNSSYMIVKACAYFSKPETKSQGPCRLPLLLLSFFSWAEVTKRWSWDWCS